MANVADIIQKFIQAPEGISDVYRAGEEYYFRYLGHVFSVVKRKGDDEEYGPYSLYVYPTWKGSLKDLNDSFSLGDPEEADMVAYHTNQFRNNTDRLNLAKLHQILQEKQLNVDLIFNHILNS